MIVELKRRNPRFGCPRIALIIARTFGVEIDKDIVRRLLAKHCRLEPGSGGPSWLTFISYMKDSLWSVDLFRCESVTLRTHWVLVVMDQFTRRIIWLRHSGRCGRWDSAVPDVQPCHRPPGNTALPQLRQ